MKPSYGANPPENFEWMIGKTVEEIRAIKTEASLTNKEYSEVVKTDEWKKHLPK